MDVVAPAARLQDRAAHPAIAAAAALTGALDAAAPRIEAARELPPDILDAMHAAGMFRLLLPRTLGGAEVAPAVFVAAIMHIAAGDASAAWCMGQGSGCSMAAAYLAPPAAQHVFGDPRDVLAWGQGPAARAIRGEGGWRLSGTWSFASGSRHATWLGGHATACAEDGTVLRLADGRPDERTFLFPRSAAAITDIWQVMGLRGTGSDTYAVTDLFIPDAFVLRRDDPAYRREDGPLYRFTTIHLYASAFAGVALGIARATLDAFIALAREKSPAQATSSLRDNAVIQAGIGVADARLRAARRHLLGVMEEAWAEVLAEGALSLDTRVAIRQAGTFATAEARQAVDFAYHEAGATAIFEANPFERRFRDLNAVTQQVQARHAHFETVGQYLLGMTPSMRWL
ncbi:MAG: hypothetical protein KGL12_00690 [Rhodospirillales bacterium]|nr:hypothetical protein [Rhodospirillales bacterium]